MTDALGSQVNPTITQHYTATGMSLDLRIIAHSKEQCEDAIRLVKSTYPYAGYMTRFDEPTAQPDGTWTASGWRLASCD